VLFRSRLTLFDDDIVCESNINRQLIATSRTIGMKKVDAAKERILEINPKAEVTAIAAFYTMENADSYDLSEYDYIIDAIDTVSSKLALIERAKTKEIPIISCMGAGNKLDPTRFEVADISKTSVCPLAKVMRCELRKRGIEHLKVVYSKEPALKPVKAEEAMPLNQCGGKQLKRQTPGSVSFVPSVAGLIIAGEVIKDITGVR
jgi:tRNA A37 threonylcarbamoyladenosine dehydratase